MTTTDAKRRCKYCDLPEKVRAVTDTLSLNEAAAYATRQGHLISTMPVQMHRKLCPDAVVPVISAGRPKTKGEKKKAARAAASTVEAPVSGRLVELGIDEGFIQTGPLDKPIGSYEDVLALMGLDTSKWHVVGETVRMSSWDGWSKDADGVSVPATLHSFRAQITTRVAPVFTEEDLQRIIKTIKPIKPQEPAVPDVLGCTMMADFADPQLGKSEGGGVDATIQRIQEKLGLLVQRIKDLRKLGRVIDEICIGQLGDIFEGCANNYASQTFTVELNQRQQINLAISVLSLIIKTLAPLAVRITFVSVLDNHTQWTRNGSNKPITGDSDSGGAFIADQLEVIFSQIPGYEHVSFITPHDEPVVTADLSGVLVAFAHGHTAPTGPRLEAWIQGQSQGLIYKKGKQPGLWITAHSHHFRAVDLGPYTWFQCPSLDGGSKWFYDSAGKWSTAGLLTMLVGSSLERGWSDMAVL